MEKLVKEREKVAQMAIIPLEVVPLAAVPSITSAATCTSSGTEQLAKAMENISIETEEIKRLEAQINILKDQKVSSNNAHEIKEQRA